MLDKNIKPIGPTKKALYNLKNILIEYQNQDDIHEQLAFQAENILYHGFYHIAGKKFLHLRFKNLTSISNKNYNNINLYTIKNFVSCENFYTKSFEKLIFPKKKHE